MRKTAMAICNQMRSDGEDVFECQNPASRMRTREDGSGWDCYCEECWKNRDNCRQLEEYESSDENLKNVQGFADAFFGESSTE